MTTTADLLTNPTYTLTTTPTPTTTTASASASGLGNINARMYQENVRIPAVYTLGMIASTLENFTGRDVARYCEKLEQRAKLDNWSEEDTLNLLKFKCVGAAYDFLKSDDSLDHLDYRALKARLISNFGVSLLPGESQLNLSKCYQRHDESVAAYCTRLRTLGSRVLAEDVRNASADEVPGLKRKSRDLILNQFKIGLRRDIMKDVGMHLLRETELTLDKAEELVKLHEVNVKMMQEKSSSRHQAYQVTCYTCGTEGHIARECRIKGDRYKKERKWDTEDGKQWDAGRREGPGSNDGCFICKQTGHWSRDCPRRQENRGQNSNWEDRRDRRYVSTSYGNNFSGRGNYEDKTWQEKRSGSNRFRDERNGQQNYRHQGATPRESSRRNDGQAPTERENQRDARRWEERGRNTGPVQRPPREENIAEQREQRSERPSHSLN